MTAGSRIDAQAASPLPHLPRPLSEDAPAPPRAPRLRTRPDALEPAIGPIGGRARGMVMAVCFILAVALAALPAFAGGCRPEARADGNAIRLAGTDGIERVRMEIGYRRTAGGADAARTYYQVVSAPVAADGRIGYRPPGAQAIVSAKVLEAKGPACN